MENLLNYSFFMSPALELLFGFIGVALLYCGNYIELLSKRKLIVFHVNFK